MLLPAPEQASAPARSAALSPEAEARLGELKATLAAQDKALAKSAKVHINMLLSCDTVGTPIEVDI